MAKINKRQPGQTKQPGQQRAQKQKAWKRDPAAKRQRVIEVASQLFREKGDSQVTTAQIAVKADVSEPLVFHYFGSKRRLADEISALYGVNFLAARPLPTRVYFVSKMMWLFASPQCKVALSLMFDRSTTSVTMDAGSWL